MAFWDRHLILAYTLTDVAFVLRDFSLCEHLDTAADDLKGDNRNFSFRGHFLLLHRACVLEIRRLPIRNACVHDPFEVIFDDTWACPSMAGALGVVLGRAEIPPALEV